MRQAGRRALVAAAVAAVAAVLGVTAAFADAAADQAGKERAQLLDMLRYGIDTQVIAVVERLRQARDTSLGPELAAVLQQSRSAEVRTKILEACADLGLRDAEEAARTIVADGAEGNPTVTTAAVSYLSNVGATGLALLLLPLVDSPDAPLASTAMRALGESRDPAAVAPLLEHLASASFPENRKGEVVRALGGLRDPRAVDPLMAIASSVDSEQFQRLYAIEALGKIGDKKAVSLLEGLFDSSNALIRAYTAAGLAALGLEEAVPILVAGLRDDNVRVRTECARALGAPLSAAHAAAAVPILAWKARNDPERQVRTQAISSLGATGSAEAAEIVRDLLADPAAPLESREAALVAIVAHPGPESLAAVHKLVKTEIAAAAAAAASGTVETGAVLQMAARVLSTVKWPGLQPVYDDMLASRDFAVRIGAIRGITLNGLAQLRPKLTALAAGDAHPAVRTEAERALAQGAAPAAAAPAPAAPAP